MWLEWGPRGTTLITFASPNPLFYLDPAEHLHFSLSSHYFLTLLFYDLNDFTTMLQEAESALNASIQDPIFHRVRDVAPNKVSIFFRTKIRYSFLGTVA